ncbi:MAG: hypothetical protein QOK44_4188, partial [Betaproteobacteria bacterium]|nr:hypothetical protein [Betaproteobacteria bacterium]
MKCIAAAIFGHHTTSDSDAEKLRSLRAPRVHRRRGV